MPNRGIEIIVWCLVYLKLFNLGPFPLPASIDTPDYRVQCVYSCALTGTVLYLLVYCSSTSGRTRRGCRASSCKASATRRRVARRSSRTTRSSPPSSSRSTACTHTSSTSRASTRATAPSSTRSRASPTFRTLTLRSRQRSPLRTSFLHFSHTRPSPARV